MCRPRNRAAPGTAGLDVPLALGGTGTSAKGTRARSRTGWAMRRRGQRLTLCWARRRPGGGSGAGATRARPGWVLQGSRACVSGGTGANPCGMPWPGERGRPRRLGVGSVGFQGSCRAGAATGTDGGRAGPAPPWGSWLGLEVLAVPTALPWPQVLLSLWPVGQCRSCPGLSAWLCGLAGGTHCPLPVVLTRPRLSEVFPSAQGISLVLMLSLGPVCSTWLCHHSGARVTPPSWDTHSDTAGATPGSGTWGLPSPAACGCPSEAALGGQSLDPPIPAPHQTRGCLAGCSAGDMGCAGSGPGDGLASCSRKYPESLRGGRGCLCPHGIQGGGTLLAQPWPGGLQQQPWGVPMLSVQGAGNASWADPGFEHSSMGWVRSHEVDEELWRG